MNAKAYGSILFRTALLSLGMSLNLHGRTTIAELLAQVAPSGPVSNRREVLSELRLVKLADGTAATTVLLGDTRWTPKSEPKYVQQVARVLDKNETPPTDAEILERLNKECTRSFDYSQLWFIDRTIYPQADAGLKAMLIPEDHASKYEREIRFIGCADQWAIYAYTPIWSWIYAQKRFNAIGGDDPLAAAARGLRTEDQNSAASCERILADAGAKAVPYLRDLIASSPPDPIIWYACSALALTKSSEAGETLVEYAKASLPALASAARRLLIFYRLPEGRELYFTWMEQDAGKTDVRELLEACATVNKERLSPFLPRILSTPHNPIEYRRAFDLVRELKSDPIPPPLLNAERTLRDFNSSGSATEDRQQLDHLIAVIISSPDIGASAHIGLSLALGVTKGPLRWGDAGQKILSGLPADTVKRVAAPLLTSCDYDWVQSSLKGILKDRQ